ncbi:hypothetical protein GCM10011338_25930 [Alteromonas lipolytica]|uniref:Long-chain fatty acid transporter n=2 Tax=Alteromonas lipolytica TaxID=1856405 RepID=A0A1E8FKG2_9ALTE|nr:hypothetical protein BFC17_09545 [Alteromonas lipolytica]GGF72550.1 hypothetical protein GCM10011338_25930 [Alteromonas lipolytica]
MIFASSAVHADQYHYGNLLVGGKAIGFGGAYASIADDLSAMHYNPAGLAFQKATKSASVNTLAFEDTEFLGVFTDGSDLKRSSFSVVPGFIGLSSQNNKLSYGTFFTVLDFSQERSTSEATYTMEIQQIPQDVVEFVDYDLDSAGYKIGGSLAYELSDSLSVGFTLSFIYKDLITSQGSGGIYTLPAEYGGTSTGFNARQRITEEQYLVEPTLGLLWKSNLINIGLTYSHQISFHREFESSSRITAPMVLAMNPYATSATMFLSTSNNKQKYPHQFSLGVSKEFERVTLSAQVDYYTSVDDLSYQEAIPLADTLNLQTVTNYSVGLEFKLTADSAVQVAFFTDNSNGDIDTNEAYQRVEDIDINGVSIAYKSKVYDYPYRVGFYVKEGSGNVRYSDVRFVESVFGFPLYPPNDTQDISRAKKHAFVLFASMDF